jgi:hypothetical protein
MEMYIRQGFHYKVSLKNKKEMVMKDIIIYYYGIEIFHQVVNIRIDADIIFSNVCKQYCEDFFSK